MLTTQIELGETQNEILRLIAKSKFNKPLTVSDIANEVHKDQAGIFRSVESLVEKRLIETVQEMPRTRRKLYLTDKGACYVIGLQNISYHTLRTNHPQLTVLTMVSELASFIRKPEILSEIVDMLFDLLVEYDVFDKDGKIIKEVESPMGGIRKNHFILTIKIELVTTLLRQGPGNDLLSYERSGLLQYLRRLQNNCNDVFTSIWKEAMVLSTDDKQVIENSMNEKSKDYMYNDDPKDEEGLV